MPKTAAGRTAAPRSRKGAQTRARLLEAAKVVFEDTGFLEARISDIAERAGLSHGSFYHYFDSKEQIFREVAEAQEALLTRPAPTRRSRSRPTLTELDRILRANRRYLERYRDNGQIMGVIEEVSRYDDHVNEARMRRQKHFADRAERAIRRLQEDGRGRPRRRPGDRRAGPRFDGRPLRRAVARRALGRLRPRHRRRAGDAPLGQRHRPRRRDRPHRLVPARGRATGAAVSSGAAGRLNGMGTEHVTASTTIEAAAGGRCSRCWPTPTTHAAIDGTGWVRGSADGGARITAAGQVFGWRCTTPSTRTGTTRWPTGWSAFDPPRAIEWEPGFDADDGEPRLRRLDLALRPRPGGRRPDRRHPHLRLVERCRRHVREYIQFPPVRAGAPRRTRCSTCPTSWPRRRRVEGGFSAEVEDSSEESGLGRRRAHPPDPDRRTREAGAWSIGSERSRSAARPEPLRLRVLRTRPWSWSTCRTTSRRLAGCSTEQASTFAASRRSLRRPRPLLDAARAAGMLVVYLKMGFLPDLTDSGARARPRGSSTSRSGSGAETVAPDGAPEPDSRPRHVEHRHRRGAPPARRPTSCSTSTATAASTAQTSTVSSWLEASTR